MLEVGLEEMVDSCKKKEKKKKHKDKCQAERSCHKFKSSSVQQNVS